MRGNALLSLAALFGATFLGITAASAVNAGIRDSNITALVAESCSSNTMQTSVNASNFLSLSGVPTDCVGRNASVTAINSNQANNVTATGVITGAATVFSGTTVPSPATVESTVVLIDGWQVLSQWTAPAGVATISVAWNQTASTQYCGTVNVTTTSTTPIPWQMSLVTSALPLNGDLNASHYQFSYNFGLQSTTPTAGVFTVIGLASNATVSSTQPRTFTICNYNAPYPAVPTDPSIVFSMTQTTPSPSYYVCKTVTLSVTGTPYFVGWNADVNVSDLKSAYIPGGGHIAPPPTSQFTTTNLGGNVYRFHGVGYNTSGVRPGNPVSFQVCWGS